MESSLHWADYIIFIVCLFISLSIGVFHALTGERQKTTGEFIMANRKLSVLPTVLSMTMSYMSAILILGQASEVYDYGIALATGFFITSILSGIVIERIVVPWLYILRLVSVFEVST